MITLGFRAITGPGMIFYFMRGWIDKIADKRKEAIDDLNMVNYEIHTKNTEILNLSAGGIETQEQSEAWQRGNAQLAEFNKLLKQVEANKYLKKGYAVLLYAAKPIITCSTCMASVHTLIWFPFFIGGFTWNVIPVTLAVALINTLLWKIVENLK
jgi:hypothetical protein